MVGGRRREEESWRRIFEMPDSLLNEAEAEPEALPIFWLFEKLLLCERENMMGVVGMEWQRMRDERRRYKERAGIKGRKSYINRQKTRQKGIDNAVMTRNK